ncbi:sporulation protein, partial [Clostridioides difficile]|nr:sporulation protein [Clostridioides difficile]MCE0702260.1 sporulation protein [Clostridioides difficile]MCE0709750.1 sporulation protein [Clostridioides difficile]MCE0717089.1 sporulation protein [Clostridioides difficile]MCE0737196.1 sporulation protein [Clostridioides difficile]
DKGTRLATYASRCIENEILMNIRSNKKNKTQVSLQDPIGTDKEGNEIHTTFYMLFSTIIYI